ncbi:hypothetical protein ZWY2020_052478 [Hordeum vulgare]|nr:hypothetical protein ZWY2020_052478 [Hordeum vulgare]
MLPISCRRLEMARPSRRRSPPPIRSVNLCCGVQRPTHAPSPTYRRHLRRSTTEFNRDRRGHECREKDTRTDVRYWLGSFKSVELTSRVYDKKAVALYGSRAKISFSIGNCKVHAVVDINPRVVSNHGERENREAFECIEAVRADEDYMVELRRMYPKFGVEEWRWLEIYKMGLHMRSGICQFR